MARSERLSKCVVCGEPMPPNEQMFKFHGYSGPCPKPPLPTPPPARGEEGKPLSVAEQVPLFDAVNRFADSPRLSPSRGKAVAEIVRAVESVIRARLTATEARLAEAERVTSLDGEELAASTARLAHLRREVADLHIALQGQECVIRDLTAERDAAVAIAREAVDEIARCRLAYPVDDSRYQRCVKLSADLRARLAQIGGE